MAFWGLDIQRVRHTFVPYRVMIMLGDNYDYLSSYLEVKIFRGWGDMRPSL